MRINNKRINMYIEALYTLLFIGLAFSVILIFVPIHGLVRIASPYVMIASFIGLIFILYKFGHQHVEYSSDGEVLNIKTQDPFWIKYFPQSRMIVDFPKSKLISYKVSNQIFRRKLELYVTSRRSSSGYIKLSFNITYLNSNELSDLKRSLNKIVKRNQSLLPQNFEEFKTA